MSATIATAEAVERACNTHWQRAGEAPSYEDVIAILGGGSNKTISAPLKEWLARPRPARHPMPKALLDHSTVYQNQVWSLALEAALGVLQQRERDAEEQVARAGAVRDIAMKEAESMRNLNDDQAEKIESLQRQLAVLQVRLEGAPDLQARLQQAESDNDSLRAALNKALLRASHAEGCVEGLRHHHAAAKPLKASRSKAHMANGAKSTTRQHHRVPDQAQ